MLSDYTIITHMRAALIWAMIELVIMRDIAFSVRMVEILIILSLMGLKCQM